MAFVCLFPGDRGDREEPPRPLALASLAVHSRIDGALHGRVGAGRRAPAKRRAIAPIHGVLKKRIAASSTSGAPNRAALSDGASRVAWEPWAIHGRMLEADEHAKMRAAVVRRVERLVASRVSAPSRDAA